MENFYYRQQDIIDNLLATMLLILFFYIIIPAAIIYNNKTKIKQFFLKLRGRLIFLNLIMAKKIKCKITDVPKTSTRKGFLRAFLLALPPTYYGNGKQQCRSNSNRSFFDLLTMTQDRFPITSLNNVIRIVAQLNIEGSCGLVWCNEVNKFVVVGTPNYENISKDGFFSSYCNKYFTKKIGTDGLSYKDLVDIRKQEQIS